MVNLSEKLRPLTKELELITSRNWDPSFCLEKIEACVKGDVDAYCNSLERELELKSERLWDLLRSGILSAEIIENLRTRLDAEKEEVKRLQEEQEEMRRDFLDLSRRFSDSERLVENLEKEVVRQEKAARQLQQQR